MLEGNSLYRWLKPVIPSNVINILTCGSGADWWLTRRQPDFFFFFFSSYQSDQPATENCRSSFYLCKGVITPPGWSVSLSVITGGSLKTWIVNIREEWKSLANVIELAVGYCGTRISSELPFFLSAERLWIKSSAVRFCGKSKAAKVLMLSTAGTVKCTMF